MKLQKTTYIFLYNLYGSKKIKKNKNKKASNNV